MSQRGSDQNTPIGMAEMVEALTQAMIVWDKDNYGHSARTAEYAEAIGREIGLIGEALEVVRVGALLHDIGKMGIELSVLKKPGSLEDHETEQVQMHPAMGESILGRVMPQAVVDCAIAHHEQPDGGGYPNGLLEHQIPLSALICRVADVLDSLTSDQAYRPALTLREALDELLDGAGTRYSAGVVRALFTVIERNELRQAA